MLHFWTARAGAKDGRAYRHFLYKMAPAPPFAPLAVSAELPLAADDARFRGVAFASGLAVARLRGGGAGDGGDGGDGGVVPRRRVVISYGSGDASGRALTLSLEQLERLFLPAGGGSGGGGA